MRLDLAQLWLPSNQAICWKEDEGTLAPGYHLRHWVSLKDVRKLCALGKAFLIFWEKNFRKFLIKIMWSMPYALMAFHLLNRIWYWNSAQCHLLCEAFPYHSQGPPESGPYLFTVPPSSCASHYLCTYCSVLESITCSHTHLCIRLPSWIVIRHCLLFLFVSPMHDHGSCIL